VASLGLLSPAAVTDGVTLHYFFVKKLTTFFNRRPQQVMSSHSLSAFQVIVSPIPCKIQLQQIFDFCEVITPCMMSPGAVSPLPLLPSVASLWQTGADRPG